MKSLSCVRFFATPWTVAYQAPPSMGFSRQECWSGLPFPAPGDLPDPGIEPGSPALRADALPSKPQGKPWHHMRAGKISRALLESNLKMKKHNLSNRNVKYPEKLHKKTVLWTYYFFLFPKKVKVKVKSLSRVRLFVTPWTVAYQAPLSMGFSRQ